MEEILAPVLSCDETKPAVGDQLLDGACRHFPHSLLERMSRTPGPFRDDRQPRRTSPAIRTTDLPYHPNWRWQDGYTASSATPTRVAIAPASLSAAALL